MLGGGAFLPVHWGTFCLAMHAWDQPAEELLERWLRNRGAQLLMPRLGEAVEPAHARRADPWWRGVDSVVNKPAPETGEAITLAKPMSWPID